MVTQFALRTDKKDNTGRCPVHLVVYFDGLRLRCATGEKCKPADWNTERQQFRRSYPLADEANDLLRLMDGNVLAWWRAVRAAGETPTVAGLKAALRPAPAPTPAPERLVVEEIMEFREVMRRRGLMWNTLRHYLVTANWLRNFEQWAGQKLTVSGYDLTTHDLVLAYLRHERALSPNSLYTVGKDLRRLFGYLRDERELPISVEPRKLRVACQDTDKGDHAHGPPHLRHPEPAARHAGGSTAEDSGPRQHQNHAGVRQNRGGFSASDHAAHLGGRAHAGAGGRRYDLHRGIVGRLIPIIRPPDSLSGSGGRVIESLKMAAGVQGGGEWHQLPQAAALPGAHQQRSQYPRYQQQQRDFSKSAQPT